MCTSPGVRGKTPLGNGNRRWSFAVVVASLAQLLASVAVSADEAPVASFIEQGKAELDLRYRYEHVDQDDFSRAADASTLRLRLNYQTGAVRGISGFVEFDYVAELLLDDFNNGDGSNPARSAYPIVADPHGDDLNQLYVDFNNGERFSARLGRQRILLDNQRFVGGVGWRQNEQTYDGLTLTMTDVLNATVRYSGISRVKRIFGERSPAGSHDASIHLLNVTVPLQKQWTATPYAYLIDNDDAPQLSTATYGVRLNGSTALAKRPLSLTVDVATQSDAGNAPLAFRANYLRLDAGLKLTNTIDLGLGYELLGGNSSEAGKAFRTPLATLHAFQGWADKFLATPDAGVVDTFGTLRVTHEAWTITGAIHFFDADSGSASLGKELDVSVGRRFATRYQLLLKAAFFDAESAMLTDSSKLWLMLSASF